MTEPKTLPETSPAEAQAGNYQVSSELSEQVINFPGDFSCGCTKDHCFFPTHSEYLIVWADDEVRL